MLVCSYVGLCVCMAMHFVMLWDMKLKLGGKGRAHEQWFRSDLNSNVIRRSSCFRNARWPPNLVGWTPGQRGLHCLHWWGQRTYRGQSKSTRCQIAQGCPLWTKGYVRSARINRKSNYLEIPYRNALNVNVILKHIMFINPSPTTGVIVTQ